MQINIPAKLFGEEELKNTLILKALKANAFETYINNRYYSNE